MRVSIVFILTACNLLSNISLTCVATMVTAKQSYLTTRWSGAYSGLSGFMKNRKFKDKEKVEQELKQLNSYALHKPAKKKFARRPILVNFINEIWTADLAQLSTSRAKANLNYGYILVVVDVFSKKLHCEMVKTKGSHDMINAFKKIIKRAGATCMLLLTDRGTEFLSSEFTKFLTAKRIKRYSIYSHIKVISKCKTWHSINLIFKTNAGKQQ